MTPGWRAVLATALLGACQAVGTPAVLASNDDATMAKVKDALARAMGQARVELGPGDPTRSPTLAVLPRPIAPQEDRSPAMPTLFRLELAGKTCFVVRESDGARTPIEGIACRPAERD